MLRSITRCVVVAIVSVFLLPAFVYAHDWQDGYCESNNDGSSHTHYYYCDDCGEEYTAVESCTWKHEYYDYKSYGVNGHYNIYECPYCYGTKEVLEDCTWKRTSKDYIDWSSKKHKVETEYYCSKCGNDKTVVAYNNHTYKWVRYGSNFWYECKYCEKTPKFNGDVLIDSNDTDNITIRKNKKYTYRMYNYNKTLNKVKSIKYSKKKICKVTKKGSKLKIKGKKKGKCKVTVTMSSGAKYVLKVKVK